MKVLVALIGVTLVAMACGGSSSPPWGSSPSPTALQATQTPVAPAAVPACTPRSYTVQGGDTLLGIALAFDRELKDVIAANADTLADPDVLAVGQVVKIPCAKATSGAGSPAPSATPITP